MPSQRTKTQDELSYELERLRIRDRLHKAEQEAFRLTEVLLRRSEERLSLLLEQTPLAYIEWDAALRVRDWNRAAENIFGYSRDEVLGKQVFEIIAPKHIRDYARLVPEQIIQQDASFECAYENVTKDGATINCCWHNTPLRDEQGRVNGMISFVQDITAHRKLDENISQHLLQLKANEELLLTVIDNNADGIVIVDEETNHIRFANPAAATLFNKRKDELLDRAFGFPLFGNEFEDLEVYNPAGILNVEMRSAQIVWEGRNAWLVSLRNVTNRNTYALEKEARSRNAVEREQLASQQAVAATDEAKLWLLRNLRNELGPPLNSILGTVQLALDGDLDPQRRKLLNTCRDASLQLLKNVTHILQLSQVESGDLKLVEQCFSLRETFDTLFKPFAVQAGLQGVLASYSVEDNTPNELYGDVFKLRQILTKLAANALRHTREGAIHFKVRLVETFKDNDKKRVTLLFAVQDNGQGIPLERQTDLFDADAATQSQDAAGAGGAGLGLRLCKQLVALLGGAIWVESQPGEGSVFLFTAAFDLCKDEIASLQTITPPSRIKGKPLKILVAEDDNVNQELVACVLKPYGHTVVAALNGVEALAALERDRFDLLLVDIQMPVMDGLQLVKRIRNDAGAQNQRIPIVAFTAYAMDDERQRFINAGMNEFLPKPFAVKTLMEAIDSALADAEAHP